MTYEYTAYVSSGNVNSGNEVLRVTAEGEFIWNEHADEMIESGDYSQYPALRHILKALREAERIKAEGQRPGVHLGRHGLGQRERGDQHGDLHSGDDRCGQPGRAHLQPQRC